MLQDGRGSEGSQPIVVVGSDTIVDVSAVGIFTVKEETLTVVLLALVSM